MEMWQYYIMMVLKYSHVIVMKNIKSQAVLNTETLAAQIRAGNKAETE